MGLLDNLVSYWKLDETSGARVDSHGSNDLTDNNTVLYDTGKIGNAADFEATNTEYLSHADNADLSFGDEDFTLACWVSAESLAQHSGIMGKFRSEVGDVRFEYNLNYNNTANRFRFSVSPVAGGTGLTHAVADNLGNPATGTWYFLVGWHDSSTNKLHIQVNDGTADEAAYSAGCNDGTAIFRIGAQYNDSMGDNYSEWDGLIDEAGLWGRVLTSAERTELYNSGSGLAYPFATVQSTGGTLTLSGTMQSTTIWKRLQSGALVLSSTLGIQSLWKRALTGLLQLYGVVDGFRRQFQSIVGTLRFSLGRLQTTVLWKRLVAGTLTFSSLLGAKIPKFVIATIRLCLRPIAVVRTWLSPNADVDIV